MYYSGLSGKFIILYLSEVFKNRKYKVDDIKLVKQEQC